jgi:hypothetical protein
LFCPRAYCYHCYLLTTERRRFGKNTTAFLFPYAPAHAPPVAADRYPRRQISAIPLLPRARNNDATITRSVIVLLLLLLLLLLSIIVIVLGHHRVYQPLTAARSRRNLEKTSRRRVSRRRPFNNNGRRRPLSRGIFHSTECCVCVSGCAYRLGDTMGLSGRRGWWREVVPITVVLHDNRVQRASDIRRAHRVK